MGCSSSADADIAETPQPVAETSQPVAETPEEPQGTTVVGRPCIHIVWVVPASEEEKVDKFWKEHEEWMRASHTMGEEGEEPRLLHFHIAKGPEMDNPLSPEAKPTGNLLYIMSESYVHAAGISKHMELGNKDIPDWFQQMQEYNGKYGKHMDLGSTKNITSLHDVQQPSIYKAGDPCIHLVWKVPASEEEAIDKFWQDHQAWMRASHKMTREGDDSEGPRLTSFNIRKGPEMDEPLNPEAKPTGNLLYIMSETYAAGEGIAKHMELGNKDIPDWFKQMQEYNKQYSHHMDIGSTKVFTFLDK